MADKISKDKFKKGVELFQQLGYRVIHKKRLRKVLKRRASKAYRKGKRMGSLYSRLYRRR